MLGYILIGLGAIVGIWQVYVLVSGRAAFGGYTFPIIALIVSVMMVYFGYTMERRPVVMSSASGGRRR